MPTYSAEPAGNGGRAQALLTALFLVLAIVLINLPPGTQRQVGWSVQVTVLRPFVWIQETLARARVQATESSALRAVLDSVVAVSTARTHLREENRRLRALLSLSERIGPEWVAASVVRAGTTGSESTFQLSVGSDEGVEVNAPVLTRHGLVGVVREVRPGSALGMDWTHPDFRASAMSADGLTYGLVEPRRGTFREEDRLQFTGTAYYTELPAGTPVLTSGRGGVYPRGIPLGRVVDVAEEDAGWSRSYWLEPLVDPAAVTHVLVATELGSLPDDVSFAWPPDSVLTAAELRELERARLDSLQILRDSLAAWRGRAPGPGTEPDSGSVSPGAGGEGGEPGGGGSDARGTGGVGPGEGR